MGGEGDASTDTSLDTSAGDTVPDVDEDTPADLHEDVLVDTMLPDTGEDAAEDAPPDASLDVEPDAACTAVTIPFEAEDMTLSGFSVRTSSREYIGQFIETDVRNEGSASISLDIPCTDTYVMWGLVWWEDGGEDSEKPDVDADGAAADGEGR